MSLRKIARNKNRDDLLKHLGPITHRIVSDHWDVHAHQSQYDRLISGEKVDSSLRTYSLLKPSIFDGFQKVVVASACMTDTMFYRLYAAQGVDLQPVAGKLTKDLRYDRHGNGDRITIYYASDEAWSKRYRDKFVDDENGLSGKFINRIRSVVGNLFGNDPFVWMGNKDLPDTFFATGTRLPNTPHGLNDYQSFHNVVIVSALNPPPAHFGFMETCGIDSDEIKTAHYRCAVYQAVMRCSIRNPNDTHPKRVVVMDRATAEWLADLFPGAMVAPLDGMGVVPRKGKPGRRKKHASKAEKTRTYRANQEREWLAQLDAISGTSVIAGRYPFLAQEVRSRMGEFSNSCDENTLYRREIVTPSLTSGTAFSTIYDTIPLDHVDYTDDASFIAGLRDLHGRALAAKENAGLFSPAHFDPDKATETSRGLDNITHLRGIWLDNDGGDLTYKEFVSLFPYLRIAVWNTYSSTPEKPRWRAFIPTTCAMSIDVHRLIMDQIEKVLNKAGYWSKKELDAKKSIKSRKTHGFDQSKFNAASLFYLPCQAKDPRHSFFIDYDEPKRGPLDLHDWIEHCILDLRPEPDPEPVISHETAAKQTITPASVSQNLQAIRDKLLEEKTKSFAGQQAAMIEKAVQEWRSTSHGNGHHAFFCLGAALQRAEFDEMEIRAKLQEEASYASSPKERRAEIKDILKSLRRRGTIRGR